MSNIMFCLLIDLLGLRNPCLGSYCGAIKVVIQSLIDGPKAFESAALHVLTQLLRNPESRKYIRPRVEVEVYMKEVLTITL